MPNSGLALLWTAEALIEAHKAAKLHGDHNALALVEAAMFHVGRELAAECGEGVRPEVLALLRTEPKKPTNGDER